MTTPLHITSRTQGQIFGAKPTLMEIEQQLANDPMTNAVAWLLELAVSGMTFGKLVFHARTGEVHTPAFRR